MPDPYRYFQEANVQPDSKVANEIRLALIHCNSPKEEIAAVRKCLFREAWRDYLKTVSSSREQVTCFMSYNRFTPTMRAAIADVIDDLSACPFLNIIDLPAVKKKGREPVDMKLVEQSLEQAQAAVYFKSNKNIVLDELMLGEEQRLKFSEEEAGLRVVFVPIDTLMPQSKPALSGRPLPYRSSFTGERYVHFFTHLLVEMGGIDFDMQAQLINQAKKIQQVTDKSISDRIAEVDTNSDFSDTDSFTPGADESKEGSDGVSKEAGDDDDEDPFHTPRAK